MDRLDFDRGGILVLTFDKTSLSSILGHLCLPPEFHKDQSPSFYFHSLTELCRSV